MHEFSSEIRLIERHIGGWIAVTASDSTLKIGVMAATENEAKSRLLTAIEEWKALLATG